jgi:hypothetical protein
MARIKVFNTNTQSWIYADNSLGKNGHTPVKGVDYWTDADKAEIVQRVIESLGGNPIFGIVDENNNIIVSGDLPDGTYSVKYEMEDGSTVKIGQLVLSDKPKYTNLATTFEADQRISTSSATGLSSAPGAHACMDYIPFNVGTTVRIKGMGDLTAYNTAFYMADKTVNSSGKVSATSSHNDYSYDKGNDIVTLIPKNANNAYIRVSGVLTGTTADVVITVDEPIV